MPEDFLISLKNRKHMMGLFILVLIGLSMLIMFGYFYRQHLALADQRNALNTTGTIEATKVVSAFKVPGRIESLLVEEGQQVQKGQELALIDSKEIEAKVAQAQGAYEAAQGKAAQAGSAIPLTSQSVAAKIQQAQATVNKAEVNLTNAQQQYERVKTLYAGEAVSASDMDQATNAYNAAQHDLELAQAALAEAQAAQMKVDTMEAQYQAALGQSKMAEGAVQEAQAYLENTHLYAPLDGIVTQKILEIGELVNAGTPVFEITDLKHTYVKVYIDEGKIGHVKLGQKADIKVDAYPDKTFSGQVAWINDAGQFAVQKAVNEQYSHDIRSFEVKIDVPNDELLLKTGMTATVSIADGE